jgi:outer membrane protein assembly factor BamE
MRYFSALRYLLILSVFLCVSCGTALPTVKPYKLDVQQGNVVTSKMLLQLRPGMTKSQVRFIMGTPLIQDSFHGNRWDYVYQLRTGGKVIEQRRVILDFENELLKSVRGDVIPAGSGKDNAADEDTNKGTRVVKPNAKPEDKSLMDNLKFWKKDEVAPETKKEANEAAPKAAVPAPENLVTPAEQAAPAEETKSILAVPIEVAPVQDAPAPAAPAEAPPAEVKPMEAAPAVVPENLAPEAVAPKTEPAPVTPSPAEASAPEVPAQEPTKVPSYESPAGMQFDRNMRFTPEEAAPEAKPVVAEPRAGNKTPPKPRDLPVEGEPGFFERMLEKIGF